MVRQKMYGLRGLVIGMLALLVVLVATEPASAFRPSRSQPSYRQHSRPSYRQHSQPSHRYHIRPSHRHHSRFHHPHSHSFFGFGLYGYPYAPYYPYYYDYYDPYAPYYYYPPYAPGEHRRFPAFRLPGFFQYPGAVGKGEDESQAFQDGKPPVELEVRPEAAPPGRVGQ